MLDYQASVQEIADSSNSKTIKSYCRWSDKDRFQIQKYAAVHGASAAAKKKLQQNTSHYTKVQFEDSVPFTKKILRKQNKINGIQRRNYFTYHAGDLCYWIV